MSTKTFAAPKHRAIVHLAAKMKGGAGGHKTAQSVRRTGPTMEEWGDLKDLDDAPEPMFFDREETA